jgi:hypothetical protein
MTECGRADDRQQLRSSFPIRIDESALPLPSATISGIGCGLT